MEQGKRLCEHWVSVKAGTGRRSLLTSEGKDFPKPLCKTTADPAADSGTQAAAALLCLPWKLTDSPHLFLSPLVYHPQGQDGKALRNWQQEKAGAAAITSSIWSVWNVAMLYCMWTDTFVMSDTTTGRWEGLANSSLILTWEQELNCLHIYTMWHVACMINIAYAKYDSYVDDSFRLLTLCICQHWKSQRKVPV